MTFRTPLKIWWARLTGKQAFRVMYLYPDIPGKLVTYTNRMVWPEALETYNRNLHASSAIDLVYAPQYFADCDPPEVSGLTG